MFDATVSPRWFRTLFFGFCLLLIQAFEVIAMAPSLSANAAPAFHTRFFNDTPVQAGPPDLKQILGFDFGERMTMSHEVITYARALAAASPRVHLEIQGTSRQQRPMGLLFVSSEQNIQRLQALQGLYQEWADPRRTDSARRDGLAADLPAQVWFFESVHGDEPSGSDAGLFTAWLLAAGQGAAIDTVLNNTLVVLS